MINIKHTLQSGFTLLEMVLVLFLIGLMASATLMLTENIEDQAKYDETKRRMEMMRKAIVGDPTRTVNGSPEISGFVVDMGRLPFCVAELLELATEMSPATDPKTYDSPCVGAPTITIWNSDVSTGLGFGWRGPYIQVLPERNGDLRFRDGYGNSDSSTALDAQYSGWIDYDISNAEISVSSDSFDLSISSDDITAPSLIVASDWQINSIIVNLISQNISDALPIDASGADVMLRIFITDVSGAIDGGDGNSSTFHNIDSASIVAGNSVPYTFTFDEVPIGNHGYVLVCDNSGSIYIFDGACTNSISYPDDIKPFTVAPRQNTIINWIIE